MTTEPGFREPTARPAAFGWVFLAVLPFIVNGYFGYLCVASLRAGGLSGISAFLFGVIGIGLVIVALGVAIGGILRRDAYGGMLARRWFAVAVLLAAGFGAGAAILPVRAALFPPPVVVELPPKDASVELALDDPTWLTSAAATLGSCPLEPSGVVRLVDHQLVGTLNDKPMSATIALGISASGEGEGQLSLVVFEGIAVARPSNARIAGISGDGYVSWVGDVSFTGATDGSTGRSAFVDLPVTGAPSALWPRTLSGELTWTCS